MTRLATNPAFRRLFWATGITNLGDGISAMAVPWLAAIITRDPFLVGLVSFAQRLPWLLFALPAGVITDRADRRRLILQADLLRTLLTAGIVFIAMGLPQAPTQPEFWIVALAGLSFLLGVAEVFRDNSAQTLLPSVVDEKDLEHANGQMWSVEHVTQLVGPPIAGALIGLSLPLPFVVDALTFAMAALLVSGIALAPRPAPPRRKLLEEMAEGWAWMRAHATILRLALMLGAFNFASMMSMVILVLYAQDILGLDAFGHGILLACGAVGGVAGGYFGPRIVSTMRGETALKLSLVLNLGGLCALGLGKSAVLAGLAEATMIFGGVLWNIVTVSYRQRHIPDALLGRVNAIYRFFGWGSLSIAALVGGALASSLDGALGREMALRAPYALAALIVLGLLVYAHRQLHLER